MNRSTRHLTPAVTPIAACALEVRLTDGLTRLIPAGSFDAPRGAMSGEGPWHLDAAGAEALIRLASARSTDIPIDYEHQTLLTERNGLPAPAAGWVDPRSLQWREDGLHGHVRWTATAKAAITPGDNGEPAAYRYLSPVFPYDSQTGAVLDLLHIALTNTPAIDNAIPALAAARRAITQPTQDPDEVDHVKREQLINALALSADATDEQIEQSIAALKAGAEEAQALRTALELKEGDKAEEAVAALKSQAASTEDSAKSDAKTPDLSQYVPRAVYDETSAQLAALKAGGNQAELDRMIEDGLADGRIPGKATADWLRGQGLAACKAHLDGAPAIAALKASQTGGQAPRGGDNEELSEAELAVCRNTGLSPDEYRKANA